jgi:hypothetical protein
MIRHLKMGFDFVSTGLTSSARRQGLDQRASLLANMTDLLFDRQLRPVISHQ